MKLEIVMMNGKSQIIECDTFEFRSNQVSNWIRTKKDGEEQMIHQVATIKSEQNQLGKRKQLPT